VTQAIILEFKYTKTNQNMQELTTEALKQINKNRYITEIKRYKHIKSVLKIGIAFSGKSAVSAHELEVITQENAMTI
jgi:hypothetical protein